MDPFESRFVPKVHPLERNCEPEDPMELMGDVAPGDPSVMLDCVLQEFAWMGYDEEQLFDLFSHPGYPVLCALREEFGELELRTRIRALMDAWGRLQFRESILEDPPEVQVVQIDFPGGNPCDVAFAAPVPMLEPTLADRTAKGE